MIACPGKETGADGLRGITKRMATVERRGCGPRAVRACLRPAPCLAGLRFVGGLSLIGAKIAAGAGSGWPDAESGYRSDRPRMLAALQSLSLAGIVIYGLLALTSHLALRRRHESARGKEN